MCSVTPLQQKRANVEKANYSEAVRRATTATTPKNQNQTRDPYSISLQTLKFFIYLYFARGTTREHAKAFAAKQRYNELKVFRVSETRTESRS